MYTGSPGDESVAYMPGCPSQYLAGTPAIAPTQVLPGANGDIRVHALGFTNVPGAYAIGTWYGAAPAAFIGGTAIFVDVSP